MRIQRRPDEKAPPPENLLRIGDFAEVRGVPAKTLRYYDRIEILNPAYVDPLTDYRYYSRDQPPRINPILALKDLGLSLKQIDELLEDDLALAELRGMLRIKRIEIQQSPGPFLWCHLPRPRWRRPYGARQAAETGCSRSLPGAGLGIVF